MIPFTLAVTLTSFSAIYGNIVTNEKQTKPDPLISEEDAETPQQKEQPELSADEESDDKPDP